MRNSGTETNSETETGKHARARSGPWRQDWRGRISPSHLHPYPPHPRKPLKALPESWGRRGSPLLHQLLPLLSPSLPLLECVSTFIVPKNSPSLLGPGVSSLLGRIHLRHAPAFVFLSGLPHPV